MISHAIVERFGERRKEICSIMRINSLDVLWIFYARAFLLFFNKQNFSSLLFTSQVWFQVSCLLAAVFFNLFFMSKHEYLWPQSQPSRFFQNRRAKCRKHENQLHKGEASGLFTAVNLILIFLASDLFAGAMSKGIPFLRKPSEKLFFHSCSEHENNFFINAIIRLRIFSFLCLQPSLRLAASSPTFSKHTHAHILFYFIWFSNWISSTMFQEGKAFESNIYRITQKTARLTINSSWWLRVRALVQA